MTIDSPVATKLKADDKARLIAAAKARGIKPSAFAREAVLDKLHTKSLHQPVHAPAPYIPMYDADGNEIDQAEMWMKFHELRTIVERSLHLYASLEQLYVSLVRTGVANDRDDAATLVMAFGITPDKLGGNLQ